MILFPCTLPCEDSGNGNENRAISSTTTCWRCIIDADFEYFTGSYCTVFPSQVISLVLLTRLAAPLGVQHLHRVGYLVAEHFISATRVIVSRRDNGQWNTIALWLTTPVPLKTAAAALSYPHTSPCFSKLTQRERALCVPSTHPHGLLL